MSTKHKGGADSLIRHKDFFMQETFFNLEYRYSRRILLGWPDEFFKIFPTFQKYFPDLFEEYFLTMEGECRPASRVSGKKGREGGH